MTLASGGSPMFPLVVHQPAYLASSADKSRGDSVVRIRVQLKIWCVSCVLQRGHSGD